MSIYRPGRLALGIAVAASCIGAQAVAGNLTLLNKNNGTCSFSTPEAGSGSTYQYAVNSPAYACFPEGVRKIRFNDLPSAMEILLTSNRDCRTDLAKEDDYWVRLKTIASNTGDERIYSFEELQAFAKNKTIFRGLKVIDKKAAAADTMRDATSCIRISASPDIDTPAPLEAPTFSSHYDTSKESEQDGSNERACSSNYFITARYHDGDEKAGTYYTCGSVSGYTTHSPHWSPEFRESGLDNLENAQVTANDKRYIYFTCPINTVMTARWHSGDENGKTKYQCSSVSSPGGQDVLVEPDIWSDELKESSKTYETCGPNQAMIGRAHKNDENGETRFLCATLRPLAAKGAN
ncbi:hypothetical protein [Pseudomonas entomophila]|uniref:hypothetical protein n=1 Tax=Pseudomonas entomophila TaxID=312306 RepID=UPI003EC1388F